jgi:5'(3')-deoxyribonucleotidase
MKTLYLDLDGVVADFDRYAEGVLCRATPGEQWPQTDWIRLKDNPRLYRDLAKTVEADQLVNHCRELCSRKGWQLKFLTAVPKGNDVHWAFYDKVLWVQRYFPEIPVMFGPYSQDKHVHCVPGDILIDDRTSNIEEWQVASGIAIQHRGDLANTLQLLGEIE